MHDLIEQTHRILIIDDNPAIHEDYRKILNASNQVVSSEAEVEFFGEETIAEAGRSIDVRLDSAFQGREALNKVKQSMEDGHPYSMAFVDMRMPPGWDGLKTVQEIWRVQPDLQVVICTAFSDYSWEELCRQLGYTDQLLILKKPFDNVEVAQLAIALTKKWALTRDARLRQCDLERMVDERTVELQRAALRDDLTGLANRASFNLRLKLAVNNCLVNESVALLLFDLDCFKSVNDSLGHPAGDQLVKEVANRMMANVSETDCVARLGGDEFAILQTSVVRDEDAAVLAKKLFSAMEEPFEIEGNRVQVGVSCGISVSRPIGITPTELMKNADLALYRAKSDGRNCFRFFEEDMDRTIKHQRRIAGELKQAIEAKQFELYYQPIFDVATNSVNCLEALIRWNHPERGIVPPFEFLPVADDTGLAGPIGKWVIAQACADATQFPEGVSVSVNVSAIQFGQNGLFTSVSESLARTGLCPSRLKLEIVESVVMNSSEAVIRALDQLHELGVKIAMDDFGTGYSSLSYLRMFPFDIIKLDRSFLRDAPECEEAMAIVRAVAMLGKCLKMELTAEGVETQEHLDCAIEAGYDYTQGYFHARPLPLAEALEQVSCPTAPITPTPAVLSQGNAGDA